MIGILGIGTALPRHSVGLDVAVEVLAALTPTARRRSLAELSRRSGVGRRHSVLLQQDDSAAGVVDFYSKHLSTAEVMAAWMEHAPPLAEEAARRALAASGVGASEIRHLVFVSCTGFSAPGADLALIDRLGLAPETTRTVIGFMGCHGTFNGLRVARSLASGPEPGPVLVSSVELCSLHLQRQRGDGRMVANALFADGAGACVVGPGASLPISRQESLVLPDSAEDMTWTVADQGFAMTLSARVPERIEARLAGWLQASLEKSGLTIGEVRSWAIHPGGPRIVDACARALKLEAEATAVSTEILATCGNMSSATILFLLEKLGTDPLPRVALAFGPGLTAEMALFDRPG